MAVNESIRALAVNESIRAFRRTASLHDATFCVLLFQLHHTIWTGCNRVSQTSPICKRFSCVLLTCRKSDMSWNLIKVANTTSPNRLQF